MPEKEFPHIASMPSFQVNKKPKPDTFGQRENIQLRSIESDDLRSLPPTSSPYSKRSVEFKQNSTVWTPISISSESSDEDERHHDTVIENKGKL
jgi:hypothetical protein